MQLFFEIYKSSSLFYQIYIKNTKTYCLKQFFQTYSFYSFKVLLYDCLLFQKVLFHIFNVIYTIYFIFLTYQQILFKFFLFKYVH